MVFVRKLQNTFCIKSMGYNSFSKAPKSFRSRKDEAKYQTLRQHSCFINLDNLVLLTELTM